MSIVSISQQIKWQSFIMPINLHIYQPINRVQLTSLVMQLFKNTRSLECHEIVKQNI